MLPMLFVAKAAETIKVDSVGKLAALLPDSVRFTIADLSVSGPLNGADLKLLQQIVTRTKTDKKNPNECLVTSIDLSGATIEEGKDGMKTKAGELPSGLFSGAKSLTKAVLPQGITTIGKSCFEGCESLIDITLPETVIEIGNGAFEDCKSLTSLTLPENLKTIDANAFEGCKSITTMAIPAGVRVLEADAFKDCSALSSITLPENLT